MSDTILNEAVHQCKIWKKNQKTTLTGQIIEDQEVAVEGDNLKECEKTFDRIWKKE